MSWAVSRPLKAWIAFALSASAVLAALSWITHLSLRLEKEEGAARREAQLQENLRLALWRLDSALAPLIAREAARPYFHYAPFYAEELAWNRSLSSIQNNEVLIPSPLLKEKADFFLIHFQFDAEGMLTSPQAPRGDACVVAVGNNVAMASEVEAAERRLQDLGRRVTRQRLLDLLDRAAGDGTMSALFAVPFPEPPPPESQGQKTLQEYNVRQQSASRARGSSQMAGPAEGRFTAREVIQQESLQPLWCPPSGEFLGKGAGGSGEPQLLLVRRVSVGARKTLQGVWIDWERLRGWLLEEIRDLLPGAELKPSPSGAAPVGRLLANVPVLLEPGPAPSPVVALATPARVTLLLSWGAVLAAVGAVGVVLGAALELGERRGRFVSAVTHELRTPLTTFRLYSQMLADGMVSEGEARKEYIATLKTESERLSRVVENVLFYARVEENRSPGRRERLEASVLLERVLPQLSQRARSSGMDLQVEAEGARGAVVEADPQAIEQILLNLVDNSCKYASGSPDRRLHLEAARRDGRLEILYRDHGPGIAASDEKKLFSPFRRGSRDRAGPIPGLGLGLALARGLARREKGDLEIAHREGEGAAFILTLPASGPSSCPRC